jgi:hypothetical protein
MEQSRLGSSFVPQGNRRTVGPVEQRPSGSRGAGDVSWPTLQQRYYTGYKMGQYLRPVPGLGVIYVKNPKAGCSTILLWLDRLHTGEHDTEFSNIHNQHRLPTVGDVGRRNVMQMLQGGAYRFSFVRNPLRRFESVYWDKIVHQFRQWRPDVLTALGVDVHSEAPVSFERFLGLVEQQDPLTEMDPHWRPQHINLLHPVVTYDHVGRLESFTQDLEQIREAAALPRVPLQTRNTSVHTGGDSVYDNRPDLVRRVEGLYTTDFELYGY